MSPLASPDVDVLGLSVLEPGILDLIAPLNDLVDSLVSALLKDGYDCRLSGPRPLSNEVWDVLLLGVPLPEPLDGWLPIVRTRVCLMGVLMIEGYAGLAWAGCCNTTSMVEVGFILTLRADESCMLQRTVRRRYA